MDPNFVVVLHFLVRQSKYIYKYEIILKQYFMSQVISKTAHRILLRFIF